MYNHVVSLLTGLIIISVVLIYGLVNTLIVDMFGPPMCMLDCCICLTKMSELKLADCACLLPVVVCCVLTV